MLTAVILEDESIAARRLKRMLNDLYGEEICVMKIFQSISELAEYLSIQDHPDILFLDIMVSDGNSFDLYDIINIKSNVIFTTAYDEFAIKALRNNAIDYLLKPLRKENLLNAINRASKMNRQVISSIGKEITPYKKRFLIRFGNKLHSVKTDDIAYIYSEDKLSFFILKSGIRVPSDLRLQNLEKDLNPDFFFRANRQFIVQIDSIQKMIRYSRSRINLSLSPEFKGDIIVSTESTPRFKKWMER